MKSDRRRLRSACSHYADVRVERLEPRMLLSAVSAPQTINDAGYNFYAVNATFSTTSSANGFSEASMTAAQQVTTLNGGLTNSRLNDAFDGVLSFGTGNPATAQTTYHDLDGVGDLTGSTLTWDPADHGIRSGTSFGGVTIASQFTFLSVPNSTPGTSASSPVVRALWTITNPTASDITQTYSTSNNLGSDAKTVIVTSSSGDNVVDSSDRWWTSFQNYSGTTSSDPRQLWVTQGPGTVNVPTQLTNNANGKDRGYESWTIDVPAGQTREVMVYVGLFPGLADAANAGATFNSVPAMESAGLLAGLTNQQKLDIVNWDLGPVLGTVGNITYTANDAATPIDAGITVDDANSATLASATVSITNDVPAEDVLSFTNDGATMGNIAASFNSGTGVMTLTSLGSTATLAQWQAALRSVSYSNSNGFPDTTTRSVAFTVNDGNLDSNPLTSQINVIEAPSLVVNTTSDVVSTTDNLTSLREAIAYAESQGGPQTITFGDGSGIVGGTNFLNGSPDTILLTLGQLNITTSITIQGNGAANTIIDGGWDGVAGSGVGSRIFNIDDGNSTPDQNVAITGVTLQHADAGSGSSGDDGGAILNAEHLTIAHDIISNNTGYSGGGIGNDGVLLSNNDTFANNTAGNFGGGVDNDSGTFTSINDAFTNNNSTFEGGGISNYAGTFTLTNGTIANNSAGLGGGIGNFLGTMTTTNVTIANNSAGHGGGVYNAGTFTSTNDTIANNSAGLSDGGVNNDATVSAATWNTRNSIISGNTGGDFGFINGLFYFSVVNADHTLIGDTSLSGTAGITNVAGGYAAIFGSNVLANNGGPTQTIALLPNGAAIAAGGPLAQLNADVVDKVGTTLSVADATYLAVGDELKIGNEIVLVTGFDPKGNEITVDRGQLGTVASTHSSGANLTLATDQRGDVRYSNDVGAFALTPVQLVGTTLNIYGTPNADVISVSEGGNDVVVWNGITFSYPAAQVTAINAYGYGGTDSLTFTGTTGNENATLNPGTLDVTGPGATFHATSFESITVNGGGGTDTARLNGSVENDTFVARPTTATLSGSGYSNTVKGFNHVNAFALTNAGAVGDRAYLFDSAGNDVFLARPTFAQMSGAGYFNYAQGFGHVYGYATAGNAGGVGDRAYLYDSAGNDTFLANPTFSQLSGTNYVNYAQGFGHVNAYAIAGNAGGVGDRTFLYDSAGNDTLVARAGNAQMSGIGYVNYAQGFGHVSAYATAGNAGGVGDQAFLYDSAGNDMFVATSSASTMSGVGYFNYVQGFKRVNAFATAGNAGGVGDQAYLYDSAGNDTFLAKPTFAQMSGTGYLNYAQGFGQVYGYATSGNAGGVGDRAYLYDSAGNDTLIAAPGYSVLSGSGYYNLARGFATVYAYATAGNAGGVGDRAFLYDSAGNDTFYGRSDYGYLSGLGFYNDFTGFGSTSDHVYADANSGGTDTLNVHAVDYLFSQFGSWEHHL